jgi:hypothetical protein
MRGGRRWVLKLGGGLVLAVALLAALTYVVMSLWNALVPVLFHGPALGYWQAAGLLLLSRILFGRWRGGGGWRHRHFQERWQRMTPEERAQLQERMGRCGWRAPPPGTQSPASGNPESPGSAA